MVSKNRIFVLALVLFGAVLALSFVLAAHVVTTSTGGTSYNFDEDVSSFYNISVNNTDTVLAANITQVNISFPTSFSFLVPNSNGTDAGVPTFVNTSSVLSWENGTGLVMNITEKHFWFNLTAATPGTYNITVITTNVTDTVYTNISITVNDTTDPSSIEFVSPSEDNNSIVSKASVLVNVTASDNGAIDTIIIRLFNSTNDQINSTTSSTSPVYINFTGLSDGVHYFNATVNDTYGNSNSTPTRIVTLDSSNPTITLISPADGASSTTSAYNFTFNVTDDQTIANCSLIVDGTAINVLTSVNNTGGTNGMYNSSFSGAEHTWNVNCTDSAGNVENSSSRTFTVTAEGSSSSSGGATGGNAIFRPTESALAGGYDVRMFEDWQVSLEINGSTHVFEVVEISNGSAKITVSSDSQEATLSVGEERAFELTGDNYYDLLIRLNSIRPEFGNRADFTVQTIHEEIGSVERERRASLERLLRMMKRQI